MFLPRGRSSTPLMAAVGRPTATWSVTPTPPSTLAHAAANMDGVETQLPIAEPAASLVVEKTQPLPLPHPRPLLPPPLVTTVAVERPLVELHVTPRVPLEAAAHLTVTADRLTATALRQTAARTAARTLPLLSPRRLLLLPPSPALPRPPPLASPFLVSPRAS